MKKTLNYLAFMIFELTSKLQNVYGNIPENTDKRKRSLRNYFISMSIFNGENFVFYILTIDFVIIFKLINSTAPFLVLVICAGCLAYALTYYAIDKDNYFRNTFLINEKANPSKNRTLIYFLVTSVFVAIPIILLLIKYA